MSVTIPQHPLGPIYIYLFKATGPVPSGGGLLVNADGEDIGLFRTWPPSIRPRDGFLCLVPARSGQPDQWLQPDEVELLRSSNGRSPAIGCLTFRTTTGAVDVPTIEMQNPSDQVVEQILAGDQGLLGAIRSSSVQQPALAPLTQPVPTLAQAASLPAQPTPSPAQSFAESPANSGSINAYLTRRRRGLLCTILGRPD